MSTSSHATIEDLYEVEGKAELVNGEIVLMSPASQFHGRAARNIVATLQRYAESIRTGEALGDSVGYLCDLPHRKSLCPDAAYYTGPESGSRYLPEAPVFAVEVRSESDFGVAAEQAMAEKRSDYFAAGTQVVWDVDPLREMEVRVFRSSDPEHPKTYVQGEVAEAEPAVPGWTMPVDNIFLQYGA